MFGAMQPHLCTEQELTTAMAPQQAGNPAAVLVPHKRPNDRIARIDRIGQIPAVLRRQAQCPSIRPGAVEIEEAVTGVVEEHGLELERIADAPIVEELIVRLGEVLQLVGTALQRKADLAIGGVVLPPGVVLAPQRPIADVLLRNAVVGEPIGKRTAEDVDLRGERSSKRTPLRK
jgi:hypothetical protein